MIEKDVRTVLAQQIRTTNAIVNVVSVKGTELCEIFSIVKI